MENWNIDAYEEDNQVSDLLQHDLMECLHKLKEEDSPFWRRTFVRAFFALVEGAIFGMKLYALIEYKKDNSIFSFEELSILTELTWDINDKGDLVVQKRMIQLEKNLKFTFKAYARAFGSSHKLNLGDAKWDSFKKALKIRHRLTHPKVAKDLLITDEDLHTVKLGMKWFLQSCVDSLRSMQAAFRTRANASPDA